MQCGRGLSFAAAAEAIASVTDEARLEALLGPAQLIGAPPEHEADEEWSYQTRAITHRSAALRTGIDLAHSWIFPVRKARSTFFARIVLVGRARTSDVFIDHASISKLHARIRRHESGSYTIADAGSKNGTWVAGRPVGEAEVELAPSVSVRLGDWELRFEDREGTLGLLRSP